MKRTAKITIAMMAVCLSTAASAGVITNEKNYDRPVMYWTQSIYFGSAGWHMNEIPNPVSYRLGMEFTSDLNPSLCWKPGTSVGCQTTVLTPGETGHVDYSSSNVANWDDFVGRFVDNNDDYIWLFDSIGFDNPNFQVSHLQGFRESEEFGKLFSNKSADDIDFIRIIANRASFVENPDRHGYEAFSYLTFQIWGNPLKFKEPTRVPEPASALLMSFGLAAAAMASRRSRRLKT